MTDTPLSESSSAQADASGIARAQLGPLRAFEKWQVRRIAVSSTSTVLIPTARIYRGAESPSRLIDGTYTGTLDSTDTVDIALRSGDRIMAVWTGCDVGAVCTLTIEGNAER